LDLPLPPPGEPPHVAVPLVTSVWPLLQQMAQSATWGQDMEVVAASLKVFEKLLLALPDIVISHLQQLVEVLVGIFERQRWPCALECVSTVVEAFGGTQDSGPFLDLLRHITSHTVAFVQSGHPPTAEPELMAGFFTMAQRYCLFCPEALTSSPELATIWDLAVACVECVDERYALAAVLRFISTLFSLRGKPHLAEAFQGTVVPLVLSQGQRLVRAIFHALAVGCQSLVRNPLIECLYVVMSTVGMHADSPCPQWVFAALAEDMGPQVAPVSPEARQRVLSALVAFSLPDASSKRKCKMVIGDFAKVCNGEASEDDLVYEH